MITDATITTTALLCSSLQVGQVTLFTSSSVVSLIYALNLLIIFKVFTFCTGGEIRTPIKGFGDLYSTLELHLFVSPAISTKQQAMFPLPTVVQIVSI